MPSIRLPRFAKIPLLLSAGVVFLSSSAILGQVAIYDAQTPLQLTSSPFTNPAGVAISGADVYVADGSSGKVYELAPQSTGSNIYGATPLTTSGFTLDDPVALALDSYQSLYIADPKGHQVIKVGGGNFAIPYGTATENPAALTVDSQNDLYIADPAMGAIYEVQNAHNPGGTASKLLIGSGYEPVGLAVDASGNLYFADASSNYIYKYSGGAVQSFLTTSVAGAFNFANATSPVGMGFDPAGNFYVLDKNNNRLIEATVASNFATTEQVPFSTITSAGSMATGPTGNLYISDNGNKAVDEIFYNNNPVNFGEVPAGTVSSPPVTVNYNFLETISTVSFYQSMQGDPTGEFVAPATDSCLTFQEYGFNQIDQGTQCSLQFEADYQAVTPGLRIGSFGLTDSNGDILAVPSFGISEAGSMSLYPGFMATVENSSSSKTLLEPQGLAVTGNGGTLFVADEGGNLGATPQTYTQGGVYEYAAGAGTPTELRCCGGMTPMALALDPTGNLYVADYDGTITVVPPPWTGFGTQLTTNQGAGKPLPGGILLDHAIALAFDPSGNLYIGDTGPAGTAATAANPGFIVKVPADGGNAVKLSGGVTIVYPQALATDSLGNLFVGDGGDGQTDMGGIDVIPVSTGSAVALNFVNGNSVSQPSGLAVDAANDLYVLDGYNQRILVASLNYSTNIPQVGQIVPLGEGDVLPGVSGGLTSVLITPSSLVLWPGGQNITIADIGFQPTNGGTQFPAQVLTLQTRNSYPHISSGSATVFGFDVGNTPVTLGATTQTGSGNFTLAGCAADEATTGLGVANPCVSDITENGSSAGLAIFTLHSAQANPLGNQITVSNGEPTTPDAVLSKSGRVDGIITVTVENVGSQPLVISNVTLTGAFNAGLDGGTCSTGTSLTQGSTCTILVSMGDIYSDGTVQVTDNSGGTAGAEQSEYVEYFILGGADTGGGSLGASPAELLGGADPAIKLGPTSLAKPTVIVAPAITTTPAIIVKTKPVVIGKPQTKSANKVKPRAKPKSKKPTVQATGNNH